MGVWEVDIIEPSSSSHLRGGDIQPARTIIDSAWRYGIVTKLSFLSSAVPADRETPCVKVCRIDPASRLCRGCGRSLHEIANWASIGPEGRLRVLDDLLSRMMRLERDGQALYPKDAAPDAAPEAKPFRYRFKRTL